MNTNLLTLKEAAERTGSTLSFWRKQVLLKTIPIVHVGRCVRIMETDLEAWILARKSQPTALQTGAAK